MSTATLDPAVARYVERFDPPRDALYERRVAAMERFKALGFPGPRDESWRQTPIKGITGTAFLPASEVTVARGKALLRGLDRPDWERAWLFVNGRLTWMNGGPPWGRVDTVLPAPGDHPFELLNAALAPPHVRVDLGAGTARGLRPHETLVVCLNVPGADPAEHHGGLHYVVPAGTTARILEVHVSCEAEVPTFSTHVSRFAMGDGAQVEHVVWQQLGPKAHHVAITQAELGRDARLACHGFTDGGALTRNEVRVRFTAPGGEADLHGLLLGRGSDLVDYHTLVEHATTDSASRQLYKGVFTDRAKGVFEGQVRIRPGAQRTNATQSVKHLLLSAGALAHAKPVLEILADDVKCAHGAAIGQLDEAALFYLRSRGVPFADARRLLVEAFADDVIGRIGDPTVREWLGPRVRAALPPGDA